MDRDLKLEKLAHFTGSSTFYSHWLGPLYTEGAKYVADHGGAYWLLDEIVTNQMIPHIRREEFQSWTLSVLLEKQTAALRCEDGNGRVVFSKFIAYTDFPLPEITLWYENKTIYLPSER